VLRVLSCGWSLTPVSMSCYNPAASAASVGDTLAQASSLNVGQYLLSAGGAYKAVFDATGSLVVIRVTENTQLYSSNTGSANPGRAELQVRGCSCNSLSASQHTRLTWSSNVIGVSQW
jgi:hypothetical protein